MMKYISALFLVLLLAPFAFSQSEVLEMIQRSDEGKEVLNAIYLDVALDGSKLNAATVKSRLNILRNYGLDFAKRLKGVGAKNHKDCKRDLKALGSRFHDFTLRTVALQREYKLAKKEDKISEVAVKRAEQDLNIYKRFVRMNHDNHQGWRKFWGTLVDEYKKANSIINRVRTHIRSLHRAHTNAALVELPGDYVQAMTEITTEFQNIGDGLFGVKPVLSNLLQVISNKKHLYNKSTRRQIRFLIANVSEFLHDLSYKFQEEQEHEENLFGEIKNMFNDGIVATKRVVDQMKIGRKAAITKVAWLESAVKEGDHITIMAKNIVDVKRKECKHVGSTVSLLKSRNIRFLRVLSQLQEVLNNRFGELRSFFIQKIENSSDS